MSDPTDRPASDRDDDAGGPVPSEAPDQRDLPDDGPQRLDPIMDEFYGSEGFTPRRGRRD